MQRDQIPDDLHDLAFELFYWFSRFEFALKECDYLKSHEPGANAEPSWLDFVKCHHKDYVLSATAKALIAADPKRQVVGHGGLEFRPVGFDDKPSNLGKVVRLAHTVRNNLFHGGKHGHDMWDEPERMRELLPLVITVLNELAAHAGIRRY